MIPLLILLLQTGVAEKMTYYTTCYAEEMQMLHPANPEGWILTVVNGEIPDSTGRAWHGEAEADVKYRTATITYDTLNLAKHPDWYLRQTAVHELWHIILWELAELAEAYHFDWAYQEEEKLNTKIERWPFWLEMCP